jgi:hypothetical protein
MRLSEKSAVALLPYSCQLSALEQRKPVGVELTLAIVFSCIRNTIVADPMRVRREDAVVGQSELRYTPYSIEYKARRLKDLRLPPFHLFSSLHLSN